MNYSPAAKALIQKWEGCAKIRADGKVEAYPDPASSMGRGKYPKDGPDVSKGAPWTIGFGTTGSNVTRGTVWSMRQCEEAFEAHIAYFSTRVDALVKGVPTTQNQFDALVSFAYNLGAGALAGSTLLRKHLSRDHAGAKAEFGKWVNAGGKKLTGLVNRRAEEAVLYAR